MTSWSDLGVYKHTVYVYLWSLSVQCEEQFLTTTSENMLSVAILARSRRTLLRQIQNIIELIWNIIGLVWVGGPI